MYSAKCSGWLINEHTLLSLPKLQDKIPIGISFPKEVISRIDNERGDVPRSRYILRIVETQHKRRSKDKDCSKEKNNSDSLEGRIERLHPSESQSTTEDVISNGQ